MAKVYRNLKRPALSSTTTIDPRMLEGDLTLTVQKLSPESTPIQSILKYLGTGPAPKGHKIEVMAEHEFDHWDYAEDVLTGFDAAGVDFARFAKLKLTQPSRPDLQGVMFYDVQDTLILPNGQVGMVVMTPRRSITVNGTELSLPVALTGDTATRTEDGWLIVRNIEAQPIIPFTEGDVIYTARTIYESQRWEAEHKRSDFLFDCNYVEHMESPTIRFTEDMKNWVKTKGTMPDIDYQLQDQIINFKKSVDYALLWHERNIDLVEPDRPMRRMRGLFHHIQSNVSYYNPALIFDYELMIQNFMVDQAFRYNSPGVSQKLGISGNSQMINFGNTFRDMRRADKNLEGGLKIAMDTYTIGNYTLKMVRNELLRQDTAVEDWMFVIEPNLAKLRLVPGKEYNGKALADVRDRDYIYGLEWQGTVAWNLEQHHALLRT